MSQLALDRDSCLYLKAQLSRRCCRRSTKRNPDKTGDDRGGDWGFAVFVCLMDCSEAVRHRFIFAV